MIEKIKKGYGKVEVLAQKKEIFEMINQGYPIQSIFEKLTEENKITLKRTGFYAQVKKLTLEPQKITNSDEIEASKKLSTDKTEQIDIANKGVSEEYGKDFDINDYWRPARE